MKTLIKGIAENLRFLVAEVSGQIATLDDFIVSDDSNLAQRILDRSGYANNLKQRILESCVQQLALCSESEAETLMLRSLEVVASELDAMTGLCRDAVGHLSGSKRHSIFDPSSYSGLLERIDIGLEWVMLALEKRDTQLALKLADLESRIDRGCRKLRKSYISELKQSKKAESLIAALFVAHSVEQMGNALLNISEAVLSYTLGQPMSVERYNRLQKSMAQLDTKGKLEDLQVERIAETRSGSGISGISDGKHGEEGYLAIYKDGEKRKLKEERQGVESWHEIYPGLAPKILSYHKRGKSASLLIEHLSGLTFEQILLHEPPKLMDEALTHLGKTLQSVWKETQTDKALSADFMHQAQRRMDEVYAIHPEFARGDTVICDLPVDGFNRLLDKAKALESELQPPFSVYIHGDFNIDNIIYDAEEKAIKFIDLHRSRYLDYVQDVSVFMVSNYRLQILDASVRRRIMQLAKDFYQFAAKFARKQGDETFDVRLALGLARSFATSTRFILDKSLARSMFLRARYLIEQVLALDPAQRTQYRIPIQEVFIGCSEDWCHRHSGEVVNRDPGR
jgi:phosphate uptake regulator